MVDKRYVFWSVRWYTSVYCEYATTAVNMKALSSLCPRRNPRRERRSFRATPSRPIIFLSLLRKKKNHVDRSRRSTTSKVTIIIASFPWFVFNETFLDFFAAQSMPETLHDLQINKNLTFPLTIKELNEHRNLVSWYCKVKLKVWNNASSCKFWLNRTKRL